MWKVLKNELLHSFTEIAVDQNTRIKHINFSLYYHIEYVDSILRKKKKNKKLHRFQLDFFFFNFT